MKNTYRYISILFLSAIFVIAGNVTCFANQCGSVTNTSGCLVFIDSIINNLFVFNNLAKPPIPKKVPKVPSNWWNKIWGAKLALQTVEHALPESQIDDLVKLSTKPNGWKEIGQQLGKLNLIEKYGESAGRLVLEDAYLRIALKNGTLSMEKAVAVQKISGTKGLQSLLAKLNPGNPSVLKGRLQELDIGLECHKKGYKVVEFGRHFSDKIKLADTDLDVLAEINGKLIAIESKAYDTSIKLDVVAGDIKSLQYFCSKLERKAMPVFCFKKEPSPLVQEMLKKEKIKCLVGSPEELAHLLDVYSAALAL